LRRVIQDKGTGTESEDEVDLTEPTIVPAHVPIEATTLSNMKVTEIRAHLKMRKIVAKGKTADMLAQLKKTLADKVPVGPPLKKTTKKREEKEENSLASIFHNDTY